jgi:hypothetical protein
MRKAGLVPLGTVPRSMSMGDGVCSSERVQVDDGLTAALSCSSGVVLFLWYSLLGYVGVRVDGRFLDCQQGFNVLFWLFFVICSRQNCAAD